MENENPQQPFDLILSDEQSFLDEAALLQLLTTRIETMIRGDMDILLSSLYRLDVEEHKIQKALRSSSVPVAEGLAQLIIDRQKEKIETRRKYSSGSADLWKGLE